MNGLIRRLRGSLGLGVLWAAGAFAVGGVIELVHNIWPNPLGAAVDIWPATLALPAFFGGMAFATVLAIAGRKRRFDELSLPVVASWGALGGLVVSLIPAVMVGLGLATPNIPLWQITLGLMGPYVVGGAAAASGSLALARHADDRALRADDEAMAEAGLTAEEVRELLGP